MAAVESAATFATKSRLWKYKFVSCTNNKTAGIFRRLLLNMRLGMANERISNLSRNLKQATFAGAVEKIRVCEDGWSAEDSNLIQ